MRCAPVADREDHAVAALRHGLLEGEHRERLRPVFQDEVREVGALGEGGQHGLMNAHRVPRAGRDDHQRFLRALHCVVHDQFNDLLHLGVDALHGAAVGVGHAVPAGDVVDGEAAVPEVTACPREGVDAPAIEAVVDEFRQVFTAGAIAARQSEGRQQFAEPGEGRVGVQGVHVGLLPRPVVGGGRDPGLERRRRLRDRVTERDDLPTATDGAHVLGQGGGTGVNEQHGVETHQVVESSDLVG